MSEVKSCLNCVYAYTNGNDGQLCCTVLDKGLDRGSVYGQVKITCKSLRSEKGLCGPDAKLHSYWSKSVMGG